tara:strand:- start:2065 stop:2958 length:894 start_codon:yes stop_codon:yes gene_type:complete
MSFAQLKKNRKKSLQDTIEQAKKVAENSGNNKDDRFWQPTVDKAGNGSAIIRFLPKPDGEPAPWARTYSHGFQGPGGWFIDNCLTTLSQNCPVCESNGVLWNSGIEANKEIVRRRKRRLQYTSNIYVVKDPSNPDNDGKVFLFRYGKKIFDMLNDMMYPEEIDDREAIDPFNFWEGANYKMKIRKVDGYRNYDKSEFETPGALLDDDEELEKVYNSQHSLLEFTDPSNFKSYDEQKGRLDKVLGNSARVAPKEDDDGEDSPPWDEQPQSPTAEAETLETSNEDDSDMSFFKNLAEDD